MTGAAGALGTPPGHYASDSGLQPFDIIDDYGFDFYQGNALKYMLRAAKKGDFNGDLAKAIHYLEETVARLPQHNPEFEYTSVPYVDITEDQVIEAFGLSGPLANAVRDLLASALIESPQTVEYYYQGAMTSLRAAIAMSPEL